MTNNNDDLDAFFASVPTSKEEKAVSPASTQTSSSAPTEGDASLENEFVRLLNNFVNSDSSDNSSDTSEQTNIPQELPQNSAEETSASLEDEFARLLNNFINEGATDTPTTSQSSESQTESLDNFITPTITENSSDTANNTQNTIDSFFETEPSTSAPAPQEKNIFENISPQKTEHLNSGQVNLKQEELELSRAFFNFRDGISAISAKKGLNVPKIDYKDEDLYPNYKPSIGKKIAQHLISCWDILNKYDPENMKRLSTNATDEEYLIFAESLSDTDMQLVIISYVEILINLEICEVKYEQMKEIATKNRIKKELYEEYISLQERKTLFIKKIKEQNFPIDADRLMNNYFKAAQKDAKGAFEALTKNPAMFSPIEFNKIKPKFFGLIKVAPEDGIKINQKIGAFIKKLKI